MIAATSPTVVQRRIAVAAAICVTAFALVGVRLADVMFLKGRVTGATGTATSSGPEIRADLLDRNGELLARDLPVQDLYARPQAFSNRREAAAELAAVTGTSPVRLGRIFASKYQFVLVNRQLTPDAQDAVMRLGLPGLEFQPAYKRYYPKGLAARQVIGATDPDGNGVSGLELGLGARLREAPAGQSAPQGVRLSLDMRVQYALTEEVARSREEFSARAAGGMVINVKTGEVLAMVSLPDSEGDSDGAPAGGADPRRNRMVSDVYELGSVFKIFSFAMALEDRTIRLDEPFPIASGYKIGRYTIHDAEKLPAVMSARDVLAESSNVGTAQIVLRSGAERQRAFLARLGLLSAVRSELPETASPLYPRHWGDIETATVGFGQGISVSPLSFARAVAEVVNGGRAITPTFLRHPADARGAQLIAPETSAAMRELLRYVVTNGTGKNADVPGYDVGGKTGSAQVPGPNGRYQRGKLLTSFCAIFPDNDPRYLVFVMLDEPHGTKKTFGIALAGFTTAPLAGRVVGRIAPLLGMPPRPFLRSPKRIHNGTTFARECSKKTGGRR